MHRMVSRSLPAVLGEQWQRLSYSLSDFFPVKEERLNTEDEGFIWGVQEILFSVNSPKSDGTIELFVDDLRIVSEGEVIYELF